MEKPRLRIIDVVRICTDRLAHEGLPKGQTGTVVMIHKSQSGRRSYTVETEEWDEEKIKLIRNWLEELDEDELELEHQHERKHRPRPGA